MKTRSSFRLLAKIKKHINIYPHTYTILITCIIPEGKSEIDIRSRLETRYRMRLISRSVNTGNTVILAGQSSAVAIKCVCEEEWVEQIYECEGKPMTMN